MSDGIKWCWRRPHDRFLMKNAEGIIKHGGGSLMIWGCMTHQGVGDMCRIVGKMTSQSYYTILDENLKNSLNNFKRNTSLGKKDIIFQHDNDPKHTSKIAKE